MNGSLRSPKPEQRAWRPDGGPRVAALLLIPGLVWLLLWFVLPMLQLLPVSLSEQGDRLLMTLTFTGRLDNYAQVLQQHVPVLQRSLSYAAASTALALLIAYPTAWVIRFQSGRWKPLLLGLVVVPFFTSYLVRVIAWTTLLADQGPLLSLLHRFGLAHGVTWLNTMPAVLGGLTTNALPFTILPIALSLERIPTELLEAARDLHAGPWAVFRRVVLPLSLPGVTAALVLALIPAAADVVNAQYLGGPNNRMIGNVLQNLMLVQRQLPRGAALALILMVLMLVPVLLYVRRHGSANLTLS